MPSKSTKKPEKAKAKKADPLTRKEKGAKVPPGAQVDMAPEPEQEEVLERSESRAAQEAGIFLPPPPAQLTLPLLADSATLFIQGVQHLTAQLLGTPECAPLLVRINEWKAKLEEAKKLIAGDADGPISGLKKLVIEQGQPWGEKGSKFMVLAGVRVPVKAVNYRAPDAPLTIADLDEKKVEAYIRGVQWELPVEKVLACYMKPATTWTLKDLPPQQQTNLTKMLNDPGEDGQGLRQCLKETKWQMMAPEMEGA